MSNNILHVCKIFFHILYFHINNFDFFHNFFIFLNHILIHYKQFFRKKALFGFKDTNSICKFIKRLCIVHLHLLLCHTILLSFSLNKYLGEGKLFECSKKYKLMLKAVIFDFDGVIQNFPELVWRERKVFLKDHKAQLEKSDLKILLGLTLSEQVIYINKKFRLTLTEDDFKKHRESIAGIMVEDAIHGIKGAKKAGMKTIGLCSSFHSSFKEADLCIQRIKELSWKN